MKANYLLLFCFSTETNENLSFTLVTVAGHPILDSCNWEQWSVPREKESSSVGLGMGNLIKGSQWQWATWLRCFGLISQALKCCHPWQHFNPWIIYEMGQYNLVRLRCLSSAHSKERTFDFCLLSRSWLIGCLIYFWAKPDHSHMYKTGPMW